MNMFNDLAMQAKTQAYLEEIRAEVRRHESRLREYELRLRQYELTARARSVVLIGKGEMARAMLEDESQKLHRLPSQDPGCCELRHIGADLLQDQGRRAGELRRHEAAQKHPRYWAHALGIALLMTQFKPVMSALGGDGNFAWAAGMVLTIAVGAFVAGVWHLFWRSTVAQTGRHFVIAAWVVAALVVLGSYQ